MTAITVYRGARAVAPVARDTLTWDALCDEIAALCSEPTEIEDKRDLVAFGPYALREGATRSAANVEHMSDVVMLDVDACDLDALDARIQELGVAAIVHGTPSDDASAAKRKVRVYVRADADHDAADAGRVRRATAALLSVEMDPSTINADRIGFVGRLAGTPPRHVARYDGEPLALAILPAVPAAPAPAPAPAPAADRASVDVARIAARGAIVGALGSWRDYAGRKHALCGALGGLLRKLPWTAADCADIVRTWLPANEPGVDVEAGVRWATGAWSRTSNEVSGRAALDAIVGPATGAVIEQAAMLPFRARAGAGIEQPQIVDVNDEVDGFVHIRRVDLSQPPEPLDFVVPWLELAPGKVSALQSFAHAGKTPFALLLSICVAAGVPFLDMPVRRGPVVYFDHEASRRLNHQRIERIRRGLGLDATPPDLHMFDADTFSDALLDEARRVLTSTGAIMIVIDTYSSALPDGPSFNDSTFREWANKLGRMVDRIGVLALILVHETKSANGSAGIRGISGHGSLAGALQASITLSHDDEDKTLVRVKCGRSVMHDFAPFSVRWKDYPDPDAPTGHTLVATREALDESKRGRNLGDRNNALAEEKRAAVRTAGERILRALGTVQTPRRECIEIGGGARNACNEALARLEKAGFVERIAGAFTRTSAGDAAGDLAIAEALGATAGFHR